MKTLRILTFILMASFTSAHAFELTVGGQVGALSAAEGNSDTGLGYGAFLQASALDILSLQVDYMRSEINNVDVQAFNPGVLWKIVDLDELRFGLIAGPGFYETEGDDWRFGLNGGAFGEVSFIPNVPIGLQARYHSVFGGSNNDLWSVFMTVGFRFNGSGGGDDW